MVARLGPMIARPRRRLSTLCSVAVVVVLALACPILRATFVAGPRQTRPSSENARSSVRQGAARTSSEDQVSDAKMEDVLSKKFKRKYEEDEDDDLHDDHEDEGDSQLSESAQRASDSVTGEGVNREQRRAKAKNAKKGDGSRQIVKRSLDEILKSANDESERPSFLPMKRDVYKEVGITREEVEAYYARRDESSSSFVDKIAAPSYVILVLALIALVWNVYDSNVNPQENLTTSMVGTG
eukprot:CAMPEP_0115072292 /NCGR_PEP_ID=MMETSP0227-20121206/14147_1 /TAXON_ID=89957 /ORGANISM="Polarella glacialis, Strain CCMP 1383" /LENGTH=239 /DNA_ID=CAMNT_0002459019 /DNA_START=52 /DNA_END=771 /DNA_ORIENTATION=+